MITPNKVKAALRDGTQAYGFILTIPSAEMVEILGRTGLDYVQIDGEHGLFDMTDIERICRAADLVGMTPIARVPDLSAITINTFLDRGLRGIVGPHISSKADAEQLVRACYFGPIGQRSFGDGRGVHYAAYKSDLRSYYEQTNRETLVGAMLEDRHAVDNLDDILSVPGIDFFYIGMNDFSQGLGYPGQPRHPEVIRIRNETVARIHAAGRMLREDFMVEIRTNELLVNGVSAITEQRDERRGAIGVQ
ncbi:HpcH/HpaI aldolase/citrate lyase family protein [Bordetella sp. BOR01]|uniref:HpcH/HpaI aldolase family protein n=1 Tax=Bordetella sp. BOR01 TaxID=2854779 RepID=UPI001C4677AE|nr:aldolase/citrate lyase family protein [Bordetella sp. BOR01]MBV7486355.1 siderophore biosynthesis protein SbnG [Bordetella sp. BOR01]